MGVLAEELAVRAPLAKRSVRVKDFIAMWTLFTFFLSCLAFQLNFFAVKACDPKTPMGQANVQQECLKCISASLVANNTVAEKALNSLI